MQNHEKSWINDKTANVQRKHFTQTLELLHLRKVRMSLPEQPPAQTLCLPETSNTDFHIYYMYFMINTNYIYCVFLFNFFLQIQWQLNH